MMKNLTWKKAVAALAVVALVVGLLSDFFGLLPEKSKSLRAEVHPAWSPVTLGSASAEKFEIFFSGQRVGTPWIQSVTLRNDGDLPISPDDIEPGSSIRIEFGAKLVGVTVSDRHPGDVSAVVRVEPGDSATAVLLTHGLLNPGDAVRVEVITDGKPDDVKVSARIAGISRIRMDQTGPSGSAMSRAQRFALALIMATVIFAVAVVTVAAGLAVALWRASKIHASEWGDPASIRRRVIETFEPWESATSERMYVFESCVNSLSAPVGFRYGLQQAVRQSARDGATTAEALGDVAAAEAEKALKPRILWVPRVLIPEDGWDGVSYILGLLLMCLVVLVVASLS